jgi:hypothetical protein
VTEAADTLDCGNGRGDCRRDSNDDDNAGVGISVGPDGSGDDGNCVLPLRPRGGGLR